VEDKKSQVEKIDEVPVFKVEEIKD